MSKTVSVRVYMSIYVSVNVYVCVGVLCGCVCVCVCVCMCLCMLFPTNYDGLLCKICESELIAHAFIQFYPSISV